MRAVDAPEPVGAGLGRVTGRTWETHALALCASLLSRLHALVAERTKDF